jgi:hypothetical protein
MPTGIVVNRLPIGRRGQIPIAGTLLIASGRSVDVVGHQLVVIDPNTVRNLLIKSYILRQFATLEVHVRLSQHVQLRLAPAPQPRPLQATRQKVLTVDYLDCVGLVVLTTPAVISPDPLLTLLAENRMVGGYFVQRRMQVSLPLGGDFFFVV